MDKPKKKKKGLYFVSNPGPHIDQGLLKRHLDELEAQDGLGLSPEEVGRRRKHREETYIIAVLNGHDPNGIY